VAKVIASRQKPPEEGSNGAQPGEG
jgi:hypothetical protein